MEAPKDAHMSRSNEWDSRINVCPSGSTANCSFSERSDEDDESIRLDDEITSLSGESNSLVNWGSESSWPEFDLPGTWGTQGIEKYPWDVKLKPYHNTTRYDNLKLDEVELTGVLTDRIIAACSSYLDKSPETQKYVLCKVDLSKKNLTDISIIAYHHHLQYVDLSSNQLVEIKELGQLPFLMYLDVSHNSLKSVLDFKAPLNLTYVNYSFNAVKEIRDLTNFWSITHLDLSHNNISVINGLQNLKFLRHLNLSYNMIEYIQNLNHMRLLTLNLRHNIIARFEEGHNVGFKTLIDILHIDLAVNNLSSLKLFKGIIGIQAINMMGNVIEDLMEITYLRELNFLTEIDMSNNPIAYKRFYMQECINNIRYLFALDGELIDAKQKVLIRTRHEAPPFLEAIKYSARTLLLQQIDNPIIGPPIFPADQPPPPIIVLVGPPGSLKAKLLESFCKQNPKFTILGVSHTTRDKTEEEENQESYYFIDDTTFHEMALNGEFITLSQTLGQNFGLAQSELSKTDGQRRVLMVHMTLPAALTLRAKALHCNFVLAMPSTADLHRQFLIRKYYNSVESPNFIGAAMIENCPIKAQAFQERSNKADKLNAKIVTKEIIDELIDRATKVEKDVLLKHKTTNYSQDDDSDEGSVKSGYAGMSKSKMLGILKFASSRNKEISDSDCRRSSVTFKNPKDNIQDSMPGCQEPAQLCHNVMFNDGQPLITEESCNLSPRSLSESTVNEDSPLSVLSSGPLEGTTVEEATNRILLNIQFEALKLTVEEIIKTRDGYLEVHHSNPGFFCEVLLTDNFEESHSKLKCLLKKCIETQPTRRNFHECKIDSVYKAMVGDRLKLLHNEIDSELSISKKQAGNIEYEMKARPLGSIVNKSKKATIESIRKERNKTCDYRFAQDKSL